MTLQLKALPIVLVAALALPAGTPAAATENGGDAAAAAAPAATAAPNAAAVRVDGRLDYRLLMKLPFATRYEIVSSLSDIERGDFLYSLTADRRAVLIVDPDDCSAEAKRKRAAAATAEREEGMVEGLAKDAAAGAATGLLDILVPGLGEHTANAAQAYGIGKFVTYRDVCEMPPEERAALLEGRDEAPKKEPSWLDRASRFLAR